ncbi:MAG: fibronectin type III domain-containing protein, partial [[Eubacterium] siraeum]
KSSTSVTLKWNKGTTASGYQLQQYKGGKWVTIYTGTKATNTSFTVKGLKAGTAGYRFRIRAYKTYGNTKQYGSWSSEVKVNTNPYGVGGFKAKSTAKNSITLGWNKGTTASGYQLQQYKGGKWVTVYTGTKATSTSCTIKSLKANTSYKFRIRAYKTYGNTKQYGSWSKELTVRTKR